MAEPLHTISRYNIASIATHSNSVYVSVLQISIVHSRADGVRKSLSQNFFFGQAAIVSAGQNIIFQDNKRYKQRLGPPVLKRRQFSDPFSRARVLRREKNNGKGDLVSEPSRFASLSEGEMTERHSGKTKQKSPTGLFQPLKVSVNFSVLKLLTLKLELSTEKLK